MNNGKTIEEYDGCPYFFDRCQVKVDNIIFNEYCLDNYKHCNFYYIIMKEDK